MSDDEELMEVPYKRHKPLIYGSLEERERQRVANRVTSGSLASEAIEAGKAAGNIVLSDGKYL